MLELNPGDLISAPFLFVDYFLKKEIDLSLGLVCPSVITENPENFNEFTQKELQVIINQLNELETQNIEEIDPNYSHSLSLLKSFEYSIYLQTS